MKRFLRYAAWEAAMLLLLACPMKALAAEETLPDKVEAGPRPTDPDTLDPGGSTPGGKTTIGIYNIGRGYLTLKLVDEEPKNPENPEALPDVEVTFSPPGGAAVNLPAEGGEAIPINGNYPELKSGAYTVRNGAERFKYSRQLKEYDVKYKIDSPEFQPQAGPLILGLPDGNKYNQVEIRLKPKHIAVRYHAAWPGMIPEGIIPPKEKTEEVRWGTAPKAPLTDMVPQGQPYAFVYWTKNSPNGERVDGLSSLKLRGDDLVRSGMDLYAHYSRQYPVRYEAGKYGYLEGSPLEMVIAGETPSAVPKPVPLSSQDYWFVGWQLAGASYKIDPYQVAIKKDTTFEAVFDVRKRQPVIIPTPPTEPAPTPEAPGPEATAGAGVPVQGGTGNKPGGSGGGSHKSGSGRSYKAGNLGSQGEGDGESSEESPSLSSPSQAGASGQEEPPAPPQPEGGNPGQIRPDTSEPAFGPGKSEIQRQLQWLILLFCLGTLLAGWGRLTVIHRFLVHRERGDQKNRPTGKKEVAAEAAAGLICAALWVAFFVISTDTLTVMFLALWGVILLSLSGLIIHGEYRLRHRGY